MPKDVWQASIEKRLKRLEEFYIILGRGHGVPLDQLVEIEPRIKQLEGKIQQLEVPK